MAQYADTPEGRQAARDAGNWVGRDDQGHLIIEPGHPGGQANATGGPSTPSPSPSPTPAPTVVPQGFDSQAFANAITQGVSPLFQQTSGFNRDQLKQQNDQFLADLQLKRDQLERLNIPQLEIQRQLAQMEAQHTQAQDSLAYLDYYTKLSGTDPFSASDFARGVQQRGDVPAYLKNIAGGQAMPAFQAAGATPVPLRQQMNATPTGLSIQPGAGRPDVSGPPTASLPGVPLAFQPGQNTNAAGYNTDRALGYIDAIGAQGGHKLATGTLEQLNPDEMNSFTAGLGKAGYNVPSWLQTYQKSRAPQSVARGTVMSY